MNLTPFPEMNPPRPVRNLPSLSGRTLVKASILVLGILFGTLHGIDGHATERLTYAAGAHVISVGDSMARVIEFMGDPTSKEDVQNKFGAHLATNWFYTVDGKTVRFLIVNGKVATIEEIR